MQHTISKKSFSTFCNLKVLLGIAATAVLIACSDSNQLAPVSDTAPSQDDRILNATGLMSDGSPVPQHTTSTITTSQELISDGWIGGMSIDSEGNILTADFGSRIWKVKPDGQTELFSGEFEEPSGNLMLDNGDMLQCEWSNNSIYRITPDGQRTLFSNANLHGPVAIIQRPQGDFIVANSKGKYLARIPEQGGDADIVLQHEQITQPNGLTIDPEGNIYIADIDSGHVFKWTPEGDVSSIAELPGRSNAHLVYVDGMIYVTKIWDHAVYIVNAKTGAYGIVSGNGMAGYDDGATGVATVEEPNGIALARDGRSILINTHRGRMARGAQARIILRRIEPVR